jgi:hypothetical protein
MRNTYRSVYATLTYMARCGVHRRIDSQGVTSCVPAGTGGGQGVPAILQVFKSIFKQVVCHIMCLKCQRVRAGLEHCGGSRAATACMPFADP